MKSRTWMWVSVVYLFAALATIAHAEIVYTPVNVNLPANGSYQIDLNHDGITDFTFQISRTGIQCGLMFPEHTILKIQPNSTGGIVGGWAYVLQSGVLIDFRQSFYRASSLMYDYQQPSHCMPAHNYGYWFSVQHRYLGLEFQINGQTHYGWAELSTNAYSDVNTLYGFAYETIPFKGILTGQTSDSPDEPAMDSGSAESKVSGQATPAVPDSPSPDNHHRHHQYTLIDVGTFGGPASYINNPLALGAPNQINSRGTTVGAAATSIPSPGNSNTSVCEGIDGNTPFVFHAFKWKDGVVTDLGALPGPDNCSVATSVNDDGEIAGYSENGLTDPLTGIREIRAVRWKDGKIKDLGTFGGNQSLVANINNRGQVFGDATNTVPDPYSLYYNLMGFNTGTQTRAFLWQDGQKQDLGTLGGPDAAAFSGSDHAQIVGGSYTNSIPNPTTGIPTLDPFLWERGTMIDLGTLGGTDGLAFFLNNRGQVVGTSNLAGDQTFTN